jgi:hypothetical protein
VGSLIKQLNGKKGPATKSQLKGAQIAKVGDLCVTSCFSATLKPSGQRPGAIDTLNSGWVLREHVTSVELRLLAVGAIQKIIDSVNVGIAEIEADIKIPAKDFEPVYGRGRMVLPKTARC